MAHARDISSPFAPSLHEPHGHAPTSAPIPWVFNLEATAVLLIVGGQLLAMLGAVGALPTEAVAQWLSDCLVPLQGPILFFCLGYLYQRFNTVRTCTAWGAFMKREAVVLLVPFAVFTVLALVANTIVGREPGISPLSLVMALFVQPLEPLGYLYTAFLLLAITPTVKSRRNAQGLFLAAALIKIVMVGLLTVPATTAAALNLPYALVSVAENWVWMTGGMALSLLRAVPLLRSREKAWALGALWIAASVITFMVGGIGEPSYAVLDAIGILWAVSLFATAFRQGRQNAFFAFIDTYTLAFFLMGGPFIALGAGLVAAMGLSGAGASLAFALVGLIAGFVLPPLAQKGLARAGKALWIMYPARFFSEPTQ